METGGATGGTGEAGGGRKVGVEAVASRSTVTVKAWDIWKAYSTNTSNAAAHLLGWAAHPAVVALVPLVFALRT